MAELILVDENDIRTGIMEKMEAHQKGLLHRAFSIFIFNRKGEFLLQQRAPGKYHNAGLWSNTCCSHPLPGEDVAQAAARRLFEEMGFSTNLTFAFSFRYKATFSNGLTEHEFDHVFTGIHDSYIKVNKDEVSDYCFKTLTDIEASLVTHPQKYTEWFKIALPRIKLFYEDKFKTVNI